MGKRRKEVLFSLDQFIILVAWLASVFAILYFKAYDFIVPSIAAFIILNVAVGLWVHHFVFPVQSKCYRQYLTIQTIFLLIWCPLLALILSAGRTDLVSVWIVILAVFYIGLGIVSGGKLFLKRK
jgi:hypothetical protein